MAQETLLGTSSTASAAPLNESNNTTMPGVNYPSFDSYLSPSVGIKLPLSSRAEDSKAAVDPWMHVQRHLNHAKRRYAQINQLRVPTDDDLHAAMLKRRDWVENEWLPLQRRSMDTIKEENSTSLGHHLAQAPGKMMGMVRRTGSGSYLQGRSSGYPQADAKAANQHSVTSAGDVSTAHTSGLSIEANDIGYFIQVQVGSNNDNYKMLVDSGSADTWITGSSCNNCGGSSRNKLSTSNSNSLSVDNSEQYKISYGTGSVTVSKATDSMTIAGMQLNKFNFGVASKETSQFGGSNIPFDGLLGLGGSSLSTTKMTTPIQALANNNKISNPIVGYRLGRVADGDNKGQITFGAVDESQVSGSLHQFDNQDQNGYWQISLDSVQVGSKTVVSSSSSATLDTGTSLIVAPESEADAIHNAISGAKSDGQGGYTLPCTSNVQLSFTFSGQTYTMDSRDLLFSASDSSNLQGTCVSAVSSGDSGNGGWLLGASFLKNVYFATNAKTNQVALGKLND
ncbi:hypothetical protein MYAM1_003408 [Malassezia yamatoensis]|uniref:Peptidase A1 domain-containing protein n=1 Tax=Malassezia yamatoensis TaxID=253288 RepID=A0AAJ5YXR3_9BASI|nr:hypothetical protein MYAM1_003408 [Malassezia yamatoensis]